MTQVGIEALNVYGGIARLDLKLLAAARNLDPLRFEKLLMLEKSVTLPYEDPVSCAVNAAKPLVDALRASEKEQIELLIVGTESGIDFSKSISNYVHDYLKLNRHCRAFELKEACYAGTAGLQMAVNFVLSQSVPDAKALVIATEVDKYVPVRDGDTVETTEEDLSYVEPSTGSGAVALLVSNQPHIFQMDVGCSGYYSYEVLDQARPGPNTEFLNVDRSLLSYLDCCENAYRHYEHRVEDVDYQNTFDYLAFHTPFAGMVKGVHRTMMRKFKESSADEIERDFKRRVAPGLCYPQQIGNLMGGSLYCALASLIDNAVFDTPQRVGMFSYGSGCCSEFFSGIVTPRAQAFLAEMGIAPQLANRYSLCMEQYEQIFQSNRAVAFGTRNAVLDPTLIPELWRQFHGSGLLMLSAIKDYHRQYAWM